MFLMVNYIYQHVRKETMWDREEDPFYDYEIDEPSYRRYEIITPAQKIYRFEFFPRHYTIQRRPVGKIKFSETELKHLAIAWLILTLAFYLVFRKSFVAAAFAVTTGFFLHELGHKITANKMGYWSEFRASYGGLAIALLLAAIPPHFLFAAPGAVMIAGNISKKENGIISLAGPAVNIVIATICVSILLTIKALLSHFVVDTINFVTIINLLLAGFNMIPIYPLDGSKILSWSPPLYGITIVVLVLLGLTYAGI